MESAPSLLELSVPANPDGFEYFEEILSETEETSLIAYFEQLQYEPFIMRGQPSKRRIARFGHGYGPVGGASGTPPPIPPRLIWLRDRATGIAGLASNDFVAALVARYTPGAGIGWHRDLPIFGPTVLGISLAAHCKFKLRPRSEPRRVHQISLAPRSLYVIAGAARSDWEHSIPEVGSLRYSVTYRMVKNRRSARLQA